MKKSTHWIVPVALIAWTGAACSRPPVYKDASRPIERRVEDLLSRMTLEEKFRQMFMIPGDLGNDPDRFRSGIFGFQISARPTTAKAAGQILAYDPGVRAGEAALNINAVQRFFVEQTRLGIPIIPFDEALHGLVREGATCFPQSIGLAASFNPELMGRVSRAIALETRTRGIRQVLSPVLNLARDVRWGRTEETYGEDPFLAAVMGTAFVSEMERGGVIATPKHFAANVGDGGRDSYPLNLNERWLEENEFVPFRLAFRDGGARSVMTSYNSLDGRPCSADSRLLREKLKGEWGFKGFTISDAGAVGGANVLHFTAADYADATAQSVEAGQDVIFQSSFDHYTLFWEAFRQGRISDRAVDEAVRRVLRAKFELGLFENPYVDPAVAASANGSPENRDLALQAAHESIVLLKNEGGVLPFSKLIRSIAVIGTDAEEARMGGYSGPGNRKVSILDGIRAKLGPGVVIRYAPGCGRTSAETTTIPVSNLMTVENGIKSPGLKAEYFDNPRFEGKPKLIRIDPAVDFGWTLYSPHEAIPYDWYSVRWTGRLLAPSTGLVKIGIEGNDGFRLTLDGRIIVESWTKETHRSKLAEFRMEKGRVYDLSLEFYEPAGNARVRLVWTAGMEPVWKKRIREAVEAAAQSDAVVVVAGLHEGEFQDRARLNLPGHQEELIQAVAAAGKPAVVVLVGGSAVTMQPWQDRVNGLLDVWYPGEAGGTAVADVLFGDYNPAGRLPITFPVAEGQLPLVYNHQPTGRGDDYDDLTGQPLYPFGFGMSYTRFEYRDLRFDPARIRADESVTVRFKVKNIGLVDGEEVIQLYIRDVLASVVRPILELKGFQRVRLGPGEEREFAFVLTPEKLSLVDRALKRVVEPGEFRIMIGSSSKDIRLRGFVTVVT
jgi:beta-glucosidase